MLVYILTNWASENTYIHAYTIYDLTLLNDDFARTYQNNEYKNSNGRGGRERRVHIPYLPKKKEANIHTDFFILIHLCG